MFPKPNRLPSESFRHIFKTGKRVRGEDVLLIISHNALPISRFAVQVGVKIAKRAVKRNRMKRLIRESIRHLIPTIKPGLDSIIIAQKNFAENKQQIIEDELVKILNITKHMGGVR